MKHFSADMTLADVIHANYLLLPVVNRFDIPPGFGDHTVRSICEQRGIDVTFFLSILNAFSFEDYAPAERLRPDAILPLVTYLEKAHRYYVATVVPRIEGLLGALLRDGAPTPTQVRLLRRFFREYKKELLAHLHQEETVTFPYIRKVYADSTDVGAAGSRQRRPRSYSMHTYKKEHTNVDDKLFDLKNILLQHVHTTAPPTLVNELVSELVRFERDLNDHTRIENLVLLPLVSRIEKTLRVASRVTSLRGRTDTRAQSSIRRTARTAEPRPTRSDRAQASLHDVTDTPEGTPRVPLTPRETDVLRLVARGHLNKEIADQLAISLHTVISHRKHITEKLRIRTVAGLTTYALLTGIVSPEQFR